MLLKLDFGLLKRSCRLKSVEITAHFLEKVCFPKPH